MATQEYDVETINRLYAVNAELLAALEALADQCDSVLDAHNAACQSREWHDRKDGLHPVCICAVGRARDTIAKAKP